MRIRVMLDVRRPLKKSRRLRKKDGKTTEVQLRYERIDIYCYYCGLLGDGDEECDLLYQKEEDDETKNRGPELRADFGRKTLDDEGRWLKERARAEG